MSAASKTTLLTKSAVVANQTVSGGGGLRAQQHIALSLANKQTVGFNITIYYQCDCTHSNEACTVSNK